MNTIVQKLIKIAKDAENKKVTIKKSTTSYAKTCGAKFVALEEGETESHAINSGKGFLTIRDAIQYKRFLKNNGIEVSTDWK